jgi:hypothetical protein
MRALPPSPYPALLKRRTVEGIEARAAVFAGYKATIVDDEHPNYPPWLLWDLPSFAASVMRLCRSHLALEDICNSYPDAEPRDADDDVDRDAPHRRRVNPSTTAPGRDARSLHTLLGGSGLKDQKVSPP